MPDKKVEGLVLERVGLNELYLIADAAVEQAENLKVWIFSGDMGAGKTTIIKEICKKFGVTNNIQSPTYSIVNEYESVKGGIVYHFDFYRIKDEEEAMDIGVEEYFYSGNYCFIEWSEKIPSLLPTKYLIVKIVINDDNSRHIEIKRYD